MRRFIFFLLVGFLAVFGYFRMTGRPLPWERRPGIPETFTPVTAPAVAPGQLPNLEALDKEFTSLVEKVVPSVVSVNTVRRVRVPVVDSWDYLFGYRGRTTERTNSGLGSGVIVSKEGHILTNSHVVQGMTEIQVQLTDGRTLPATLIGSEPSVDIAVLRINAPNLQPLAMGDSDQVKVGQQVVAVGNPFGLQETVTRGIVSAKGRALRDSGVEFFQTDAAVNPGNSGGPLLNMRGEIVGINSAIYSQTGSWAGISFAIPANTAKQTLESILKMGRPVRPYLGMNLMPLTPSLAAQLGLRDLQGAVITDVLPGSPADQAGLRQGDVIREFAGRPVRDERALRAAISRAKVGDEVELVLVRDGQLQKYGVRIVQMPDEAAPPPQQAPTSQLPPKGGNSPEPQRAQSTALRGVEVRLVPAQMRDTVFPADVQGVMVSQIQPDSPAAEKLRVGDVIEEINKRPTPSVEAYEQALGAITPGESVLLSICRGSARMYVAFGGM